jgi:hypothetical protein
MSSLLGSLSIVLSLSFPGNLAPAGVGHGIFILHHGQTSQQSPSR